MPELLCHLYGDYVFQNHWMATRKTSAWFPAAVHAATYTAMFLVLTRSPAALAVIGGTHLVIDRFRLARYWVGFWGVGCEGWLPRMLKPTRVIPPPDFLAAWLLIIVDNAIHLGINHAALTYLA